MGGRKEMLDRSLGLGFSPISYAYETEQWFFLARTCFGPDCSVLMDLIVVPGTTRSVCQSSKCRASCSV